jgi:hypothetical protein
VPATTCLIRDDDNHSKKEEKTECKNIQGFKNRILWNLNNTK